MSKSILTLAAALTLTAGAMAQTLEKPKLRHAAPPEKGAQVMAVSKNGLWAVGQTASESSNYTNPRMLDVEKGTFIDLFSGSTVTGEAGAVTDDGSIIGGSSNTLPAIYYSSNKKWRVLPIPEGKSFTYGRVSSITPDGKYAVGYAYAMGEGLYTELPFFWNLTGSNPELVTLKNLPDFDTDGNTASMVRFWQISADAKYIFGQVDFSYPDTSWCFLYDVEKQSWIPLGYKYENGRLTLDESTGNVVDLRFSPNGKYVAVEIANDNGGAIGYCDPATGKITVLPDSGDKLLGDVDNFGVIYASSPSATPLRNWVFYLDGYWFDWKQSLKQLWGIDWQKDYTKEDFGLSGTYVGTSSDGLRLLTADYANVPGGAYMITLPKPLKELSADLDPLYNYMTFPAAGSKFSSVRNVTVYFDRNIEVLGDRTSVKLLDDKGEEVKSSMSVALEAGQTRNLLITFRNAELEAGKTYTVVIPAGTVQVAGDPERKNKEIRINYEGRENLPVKPVKISPESGTAMPRLSMSTNPVTVEFDAVLSVMDGGSISLYRVDAQNNEEFLYQLSSNIDGSTMTIFPVAEQELAKDITYKVVIAPNTVADIAGNNGNEKVEITYIGTYENEISEVNGVVFSENFDMGLGQMMLYDGDQRTPQSSMSAWGFKAEYPWWYVRDNEESTDQSAVSHSLYTPAGQSDDWMVTPRMYIPDDTCVLTFDSQSYKRNKTDMLKVYVLATDDIYTAPITGSFIDRFKAEADLVFDEKQNPGSSEETLAGDWTHNKVDLAKYEGKHIYIAFVNDNENQSAVFVDNILVERDLEYTIGVDVPSFVVDAESIPVKAVFKVLGEQTYDAVTFTLLDGDGNTVDEQTVSELSLKKDDTYNFTFSKELPLAKGRINYYSVEAAAKESSVIMNTNIKNLRFKPERTIVIEEGTGTQCGFCPLGHRALELMDEIYGDKVIPVAIHSYSGGSTFKNNWTTDYGMFMGFSAFPTAVLNREVGGGPLYSDGVSYFMNHKEGGSTWFDIAEKMMGELTDAEVSIDHAYIDPQQGRIEVELHMKYAYDTDNANLNVHTVVLENGLQAVQSNNVASNTSTILGEWGSGGTYGNPVTPYVFNHVARGMHGNVFAGVSGMFPRVIDSANDYKSVYSFDIPSALTDNNKAEVVSMLIDANSGKIINAVKSPLVLGTVGIDTVLGSEQPAGNGDVYSVTGVKVLENATMDDVNRLEKGIYIFNGKKVMVR